MRRTLLALSLLVVAVLVALIFMLRAAGPGAEVDAVPDAAHAPSLPSGATLDTPAGLASSAERALVAEDSAQAPVETQTPLATELQAELRGRFVLANGSPASGVKVTLSGFAGNAERVMKYGAPKEWGPFTGESDQDGRFSLRFDPPLAFQFFLKSEYPNCAAVQWRWVELPPREVTDVGEVVLSIAGSIRGRLVDSAGKPLPGDWRASAGSSSKPPGDGGDTARASAKVDARTGEFLLEGLPPGPARLSARSDMVVNAPGPTVVVRSGETVEANIVYDGPDNSRRIIVTTFCQTLHIFSNPAEGSVVLLGAGAERVAKRVAGSSQNWSFDDLDPGAYTIEVRDPRYLPWSQSDVRPGSNVRAKLRGSAAVALTVLDDAGNAVVDYRLRVDYHTSRTSPHEFEVRGPDAPLPAGGVYDALIPDDILLRVVAPGYSTCEVVVPALAPGETRAVTAQLDQGAKLNGVVLDGTSHAPISGAQVSLGAFIDESKNAPGQDRNYQAFVDARRFGRKTKTDAQGRFSYDALPRGSFELLASHGAQVSTRLAPLVLEGGEREVELVLPASGFLVGRLLGPEGASFEGLTLSAAPVAASTDMLERILQSFEARQQDPTRVQVDGSFRLGPLLAAEVEVILKFPDVMVATSFNSSQGFEGPRRPLGKVTIEAGKETRHDFDMSAILPGSLSVSILVNGLPGASLVVLARSDNDSTSSGQEDRTAASSDAAGVARLAPLPPGNWQLTIRTDDSSWFWSTETSVHTNPGEQARFVANIVLIEGEVTLLAEDDGAVLSKRNFAVQGSGETMLQVKSDAAGAVKLRLPPGRYRILDCGDSPFGWMDNDTPASLEWTASGPSSPTLRVPRAPKKQ